MDLGMTKSKAVILSLLSIAGFSAAAEDLSPGLWEVTVESRVPTDAGWAPAPFNLSRCLTHGDAKDPSKIVGSIAVPGATGCSYTERDYTGGTFRFALDCAGSYGLKAKGGVSFTSEDFSGNITAVANVGGQVTELQNRVSGKRVGDCR